MKFMLVLALAGCVEVLPGQMEACKKTCAPRTVGRVTYDTCECGPAVKPEYQVPGEKP